VAVLVYVGNKQVEELVEKLLVFHGMMIVQHQEKVLGDGIIDLLHQGCDDGIEAAPEIRPGGQEGRRAFAESGETVGDGSDEVIQEHP